ncbi:hypothetical protein B7O87_10640 [Cylindrospermopsis raciborskii CENA303]|uniref:Uncharacterized protein n=1 Tax=Cylindrospermopsis raciborskii CENA303 TaxID=1170769 RepID=A0A1X4G534_9CYAN|nr:hypothetical protein [Cylindrospermopsis raciborskii]OSO89618.1 hypothetical protein B7O87_10640 [Cylindrospermopsis raciborskii CENA303]
MDIVLTSKQLTNLQIGNQLLAENKPNQKIKEYCIMQVIENNALFAQVSVEDAAVSSGGSYNFIGLLTYTTLGTLIWALDEALLPGA